MLCKEIKFSKDAKTVILEDLDHFYFQLNGETVMGSENEADVRHYSTCYKVLRQILLARKQQREVILRHEDVWSLDEVHGNWRICKNEQWFQIPKHYEPVKNDLMHVIEKFQANLKVNQVLGRSLQ